MRILAAISAVALLASPVLAQDQTTAVPETDIRFVAPTTPIEGYEMYDWRDEDAATLEDLEGEGVFSSITMERIGGVDDVLLGAGDSPTYLRMSVGGLWDIGDRDIAVPIDEVTIYRGRDWRVYIEATEEQVEDYPEYEG